MKVYQIVILLTDQTSTSLRHYGEMNSAAQVVLDFVKRFDADERSKNASPIWSITITREE